MQGFEQRIKRLQSAFQDFCKKTAEESKGRVPRKSEKKTQHLDKQQNKTHESQIEVVDLECKEIIEAIPSARSQISTIDFADGSSHRLTETDTPFYMETEQSTESKEVILKS